MLSTIAELSDNLLNWMVPAKELQSFQQCCLWNSPRANNATYFAQPRPSALGYHGLKAEQLDEVQGHFQPLLPHLESLVPAPVPYSETHCAFSHRHGVQAAPKSVHSSAQKKFLIFDQSGKDIRLFSSSFHVPSQNEAIMANEPAVPQSSQDEKLKAGQPSLIKLIADTELDENYTSGEGGGDIHEDTEEINALLSFYTEDDDGDDDDVDGENDELTSTGHSPFATIEGLEEDGKVWELTEEVASTDGSTKRQKLLHGGYKKSSLVEDTISSPKLCRSSNYDDDVDSSSAKSKDLDEDTDSILSIRQRQANIWEKLRILESILPGMKSKDPLFIIDEAISYLKYLRQKAKALEVSWPT